MSYNPYKYQIVEFQSGWLAWFISLTIAFLAGLYWKH